MRGLSLLVTVLAVVAAGCGSGGTTPARSPAGATSYQEFRTGYCGAWVHLLTAVGNPDTASGSDMTRSLEAAITSRDSARVSEAADLIRTELEDGRADVAYGAGWKPAASVMTQFDRLFLAFEAYTEAEARSAPLGVQGAKDAGQQALLNAGGGEAWYGLLDRQANAAIQSAKPADAAGGQCPGAPISI